MKIPTTTKDCPYIQFSFNKQGKLHLDITSGYWGGINSGFVSTKLGEGNTCLPKDLDKYIKAFKNRKIKKLQKEINTLQKQILKYSS